MSKTHSIAGVVLAIVCTPSLGLAWDAQDVKGDGIRIELDGTDVDDEDFEAELVVHNDSGATIVVAAHKIAVVGPDGKPMYSRDRASHTIKAGDDEDIKIHVEAEHLDFDDLDGVYIRFDGIVRDGKPLGIPPMKVGSPKHGPGEAPAVEAQPAVASPSPSSSSSIDQFSGTRVKIKKPGEKVAAMPLKVSKVPEKIAFILDELLLTELQTVGFEAIGPDDINAMVGFEGMKDQMGCDDASCAAEIGNALGVPFLVAGSVADLDGSVVITLKLINVRDTTVLARVSKIAEGDSKVLPKTISAIVQDLVVRSGL